MHERKEQCLQAMARAGAVTVLRTAQPMYLREVAVALQEGGLPHLEITMTTPGALDLIRDLRASVEGLFLGAGTVLDAVTARMAILAGADFIVSPVFDRGMVEMCQTYGVAAIPGALTPTEILTAWSAGADVVKIFPGSLATPEYVRHVLEPLPQVRVMVSGRVTFENAADYLQAGALAVAVGTNVIPPEDIRERRFARITENARRLCTALRQANER